MAMIPSATRAGVAAGLIQKPMYERPTYVHMCESMRICMYMHVHMHVYMHVHMYEEICVTRIPPAALP